MSRFLIIDAPQRSAEWFAARLGRLTGSVAKNMLATITKGEAAARRDLRIRLALERITGQPQDDDAFVNDAMQRGIDLEPHARMAYEARTGEMVIESGFLSMTDHLAGCSLDGHLGTFDTLVSIKCPKAATHFKYLRDRSFPEDYLPQMLHECWVTGARRYSFVSYDDRFPEPLRLFLHDRVVTEDEVDAYATKALAFLDEVAREVADIAALMAA
jgi:predicted phage-related endonuclease